MENNNPIDKVTLYPSVDEFLTPTPSNDLPVKEDIYKIDKKEEEIKINLELIANSINIKIKYGKDTFNSLLNLQELQEKNNYFIKFTSIEDIFNIILNSFNDNKYNIQKEENNFILNIDIYDENKKNTVLFILEKNKLENEEKIRSLYILTYKYIKENNELKEDINFLKNKVNSMEKLIIDYFKEKKEKKKVKDINKKRKEETYFDIIDEKSKIINNINQIKKLKEWLPFKNQKYLKCKLIYDAKIDGDNASIFHSLCKYKKDTLTIISTSDHKIIGGFCSQLATKTSCIIADKYGFLFSFNPDEKYESLACNTYYRNESEGPQFGYYGEYSNISIKDNFLHTYGNYYSYIGKNFDFGNKKKDKNLYYFKVIDLEIFQIYK